MHKVVQKHGRLDGVANCIGNMLMKAAHLTSKEEVLRLLRCARVVCKLIVDGCD